jgi:nicotinamidase/pyrazinamidase
MRIEPNDVLIVIDVQNDFCPGGALAVPARRRGDRADPRIAPRFQHIVLTQDWHPADHTSFAASHPGKKPYESIELGYGSQTLWPAHCVQGSRARRFIPGSICRRRS